MVVMTLHPVYLFDLTSGVLMNRLISGPIEMSCYRKNCAEHGFISQRALRSTTYKPAQPIKNVIKHDFCDKIRWTSFLSCYCYFNNDFSEAYRTIDVHCIFYKWKWSSGINHTLSIHSNQSF